MTYGSIRRNENTMICGKMSGDTQSHMCTVTQWLESN